MIDVTRIIKDLVENYNEWHIEEDYDSSMKFLSRTEFDLTIEFVCDYSKLEYIMLKCSTGVAGFNTIHECEIRETDFDDEADWDALTSHVFNAIRQIKQDQKLEKAALANTIISGFFGD